MTSIMKIYMILKCKKIQNFIYNKNKEGFTMKKQYQELVLTLVVLKQMDVITTSGVVSEEETIYGMPSDWFKGGWGQ